ncbi:MAG: hypothetical protein PHE55_19140 [Methylococcaceae bacterium]|nr:hypothetical protein [Methylococcaceae bacterium]
MIKFSKGLEPGYLASIFKHSPMQKGAIHGNAGSGGWWLSGAVLTGLLALNFDALTEMVGDGVSVLFELVQQGLETMYVKGAGFDVHHAQMATAYSLFFFALAITALIARRVHASFNRVWTKWAKGLDKMRDSLEAIELNLKSSWRRLDRLNQYAAVAGLILVVIPVLAMLSYGLGGVIAELL